MYIASLLNSSGLFRHLGDWRKKSDLGNQDYVEQFLFRATSAYLSLTRMQILSSLCIDQYRKRKTSLNVKDERIVFWSPSLVELLNEFSPFLSTLRIMQNQILPLTARVMKPKKGMPMSLADAIPKLDRLGLTSDVTRALRQYWLTNGAIVRGYRNVDQHYYSIVQHSFLQVVPEERILVLLPDNPEEQSQRRITFDQERDALPFFEKSFIALHDLVENVAAALGFQAGPLDQAVGMAQLGLLQEGVRKTLALIIESTEDSSGVEFGQTEERKIYARLLPMK